MFNLLRFIPSLHICLFRYTCGYYSKNGGTDLSVVIRVDLATVVKLVGLTLQGTATLCRKFEPEFEQARRVISLLCLHGSYLSFCYFYMLKYVAVDATVAVSGNLGLNFTHFYLYSGCCAVTLLVMFLIAAKE